MDLDEEGNPHLSYVDMTNSSLKYACNNVNGWHFENVDEGVSGSEGQTSLALDLTDNVHISYRAYGDLKYAHKNGGLWQIESVDADGTTGGYSSLVLDSYGFPHISYFCFSTSELKYAYKDVSGWHLKTVDSDGSVGMYTSLMLDSAGYPHISYNGAAWDLKYAFEDQNGWHITVVDDESWVSGSTSLEVDASDQVHIVYCDFIGEDLKYACKEALPLTETPKYSIEICPIDIWPNPVRDLVYAKLGLPNADGMIRLSVFDLNGRKVTSLQQPGMMNQETVITLRLPDEISTGQYFLGFEGEGTKEFVPITVLK